MTEVIAEVLTTAQSSRWRAFQVWFPIGHRPAFHRIQNRRALRTKLRPRSSAWRSHGGSSSVRRRPSRGANPGRISRTDAAPLHQRRHRRRRTGGAVKKTYRHRGGACADSVLAQHDRRPRHARLAEMDSPRNGPRADAATLWRSTGLAISFSLDGQPKPQRSVGVELGKGVRSPKSSAECEWFAEGVAQRPPLWRLDANTA